MTVESLKKLAKILRGEVQFGVCEDKVWAVLTWIEAGKYTFRQESFCISLDGKHSEGAIESLSKRIRDWVDRDLNRTWKMFYEDKSFWLVLTDPWFEIEGTELECLIEALLFIYGERKNA